MQSAATVPPPPGEPPGGIDVTTPDLYADEARLHATFAWMRAYDPVRWMEPEGYRPFWAVTRRADVVEIERQHGRFLNAPRAILALEEVVEAVRAFTGGSPHLVRTLVHMDEPEHRVMRGLTNAWFLPANLKRLVEPKLKARARQSVDHMLALGGACDFVRDVAIWYPLRVIMDVLGVPEEDEPRMLKLTQELFGNTDAETRRNLGEAGDLIAVVLDFYQYFRALTEDRRRQPRDDLASVIANARIDGEPIGDIEAMGYYTIVATAGHDTTSSSTAGGLHALVQHPDEFRRLRDDPSLMPLAVDEAIRWVTPVRHFMRTATEDYDLRGRRIRAGDDLMLLYPSANRDEEAFEEPFRFKVDRSPNPHVGFGYGVHLCLGHLLAKMEMRALYQELFSRLDWVELDGEPAWVASSFVGGLKRLPIRYGLRPAAD
ncbi:cytochrome P450 [Rhodocista pekingensis]|uniref:Cytochrome P450 n=1 Tax=Rhodocista pekingensis TaxID=201185 RepID=A0ABW2KQU8_9PROT